MYPKGLQSMSKIYPGQHWPPEPGDVYFAEVYHAEDAGAWTLRKTTPACTWHTAFSTQKAALEAQAQFYEDCGLTPERREQQARAKRARVIKQLGELSRELLTLGDEPLDPETSLSVARIDGYRTALAQARYTCSLVMMWGGDAADCVAAIERLQPRGAAVPNAQPLKQTS